MPRPDARASRSVPVFFLACTLGLAAAQAEEAAPNPEVVRANATAVEATERANRLRAGGRDDLAKLADELADERRALARDLERAAGLEREAARAEEVHAESLRELDRAAAAREERRQRIARLADQVEQAEADRRDPRVVSMPTQKKGANPKGIALDADGGKRGAREAESKGATEPKRHSKQGATK